MIFVWRWNWAPIGVVLGTVAIEKPELVAMALERWGAERILVGIYTRNGKVVTHGWQKTTDVDAVDLGHRMYAIGVRHVVYTDISRDGTLSGINIKEAAQLAISQVYA
ncbi:MAG: HisA/HisF-related TIM barrel protein [Caldilineaceae bacterium]